MHFQNGRYPNVEALAADLEVMFANAKRYNMDESKLFKVSVTPSSSVESHPVWGQIDLTQTHFIICHYHYLYSCFRLSHSRIVIRKIKPV